MSRRLKRNSYFDVYNKENRGRRIINELNEEINRELALLERTPEKEAECKRVIENFFHTLKVRNVYKKVLKRNSYLKYKWFHSFKTSTFVHKKERLFYYISKWVRFLISKRNENSSKNAQSVKVMNIKERYILLYKYFKLFKKHHMKWREISKRLGSIAESRILPSLKLRRFYSSMGLLKLCLSNWKAYSSFKSAIASGNIAMLQVGGEFEHLRAKLVSQHNFNKRIDQLHIFSLLGRYYVKWKQFIVERKLSLFSWLHKWRKYTKLRRKRLCWIRLSFQSWRVYTKLEINVNEASHFLLSNRHQRLKLVILNSWFELTMKSKFKLLEKLNQVICPKKPSDQQLLLTCLQVCSTLIAVVKDSEAMKCLYIVIEVFKRWRDLTIKSKEWRRLQIVAFISCIHKYFQEWRNFSSKSKKTTCKLIIGDAVALHKANRIATMRFQGIDQPGSFVVNKLRHLSNFLQIGDHEKIFEILQRKVNSSTIQVPDASNIDIFRGLCQQSSYSYVFIVLLLIQQYPSLLSSAIKNLSECSSLHLKNALIKIKYRVLIETNFTQAEVYNLLSEDIKLVSQSTILAKILILFLNNGSKPKKLLPLKVKKTGNKLWSQSHLPTRVQSLVRKAKRSIWINKAWSAFERYFHGSMNQFFYRNDLKLSKADKKTNESAVNELNYLILTMSAKKLMQDRGLKNTKRRRGVARSDIRSAFLRNRGKTQLQPLANDDDEEYDYSRHQLLLPIVCQTIYQKKAALFGLLTREHLNINGCNSPEKVFELSTCPVAIGNIDKLSTLSKLLHKNIRYEHNVVYRRAEKLLYFTANRPNSFCTLIWFVSLLKGLHNIGTPFCILSNREDCTKYFEELKVSLLQEKQFKKKEREHFEEECARANRFIQQKMIGVLNYKSILKQCIKGLVNIIQNIQSRSAKLNLEYDRLERAELTKKNNLSKLIERNCQLLKKRDRLIGVEAKRVKCIISDQEKAIKKLEIEISKLQTKKSNCAAARKVQMNLNRNEFHTCYEQIISYYGSLENTEVSLADHRANFQRFDRKLQRCAKIQDQLTVKSKTICAVYNSLTSFYSSSFSCHISNVNNKNNVLAEKPKVNPVGNGIFAYSWQHKAKMEKHRRVNSSVKSSLLMEHRSQKLELFRSLKARYRDMCKIKLSHKLLFGPDCRGFKQYGPFDINDQEYLKLNVEVLNEYNYLKSGLYAVDYEASLKSLCNERIFLAKTFSKPKDVKLPTEPTIDMSNPLSSPKTVGATPELALSGANMERRTQSPILDEMEPVKSIKLASTKGNSTFVDESLYNEINEVVSSLSSRDSLKSQGVVFESDMQTKLGCKPEPKLDMKAVISNAKKILIGLRTSMNITKEPKLSKLGSFKKMFDKNNVNLPNLTPSVLCYRQVRHRNESIPIEAATASLLSLHIGDVEDSYIEKEVLLPELDAHMTPKRQLNRIFHRHKSSYYRGTKEEACERKPVNLPCIVTKQLYQKPQELIVSLIKVEEKFEGNHLDQALEIIGKALFLLEDINIQENSMTSFDYTATFPKEEHKFEIFKKSFQKKATRTVACSSEEPQNLKDISKEYGRKEVDNVLEGFLCS